MQYLSMISGVIVGIIIFHTIYVTRTVFHNLDEENTKIFLRAIFPKFFLLLNFLGFAFLLVGGYINPGLNEIFFMGCSNTVLPAIAYFLIPITNRAKDEGQESKFKTLHSISVLLTLVLLLSNCLILLII
tara:strand:- start:1613 stop:2002 length:390 start_codon:yes stop_codon:yes gene_type:complete